MFFSPQFDGQSGESFQQAAATFCKYQSVALESLKERRKKESKLQVRYTFNANIRFLYKTKQLILRFSSFLFL